MSRALHSIVTGGSLAAVFVLWFPFAAGAQEKNHASYWISRYQLVDPIEVPLAVRAEEIFDRLAAAADQRANRMPRLAVLDARGTPLAMALPDGTVLLTKDALAICYRNVPLETGDARLAFVIGHELSHLGNDDFWHASAFDALVEHASPEEAGDVVLGILRSSPDDVRRRELQADAYGMFYMTAAGYDPHVILRGSSFFAEWVDELDTLGIRSMGAQLAPSERAFFVRTQLTDIANEVDFFYFGVRLVQLGRFQDALLFLERFRDRFPSREVLSNIGVAHFQLAARFLGTCDGLLVTRFKLPTVLDSETRAVRLRGGERSGCFNGERFRLHFREAERNLVEAAEMDSSYAPARLNLLSLYALAQEGARALVVAEEAREILPDDARVLSGAAVALYLYGEQSALEMADTAIEQLQAIRRAHPESAEAAYNLASMLSERRRVQAAEEAYRAFLVHERFGVFARVARDYIGLAPESEPVSAPSLEVPEPPLPLGPMASPGELAASTPGLRVEEFTIGNFNGSFMIFDGGRALAIDDTIELVERRVGSATIAIDAAGPARTMTTTHEHLTFFRNVVVVSSSGKPVTLLYTSD